MSRQKTIPWHLAQAAQSRPRKENQHFFDSNPFLPAPWALEAAHMPNKTPGDNADPHDQSCFGAWTSANTLKRGRRVHNVGNVTSFGVSFCGKASEPDWWENIPRCCQFGLTSPHQRDRHILLTGGFVVVFDQGKQT